MEDELTRIQNEHLRTCRFGILQAQKSSNTGSILGHTPPEGNPD